MLSIVSVMACVITLIIYVILKMDCTAYVPQDQLESERFSLIIINFSFDDLGDLEADMIYFNPENSGDGNKYIRAAKDKVNKRKRQAKVMKWVFALSLTVMVLSFLI